MFLERILKVNNIEYKDGKFSNLNLKNDLHIAMYIIEILKPFFNFTESDDELKISKVNKSKDIKIIDFNEFFYWWQFTRYNQISSEEKVLIEELKSLQKEFIEMKNSFEKFSKENPENKEKLEELSKQLQNNFENLKNKEKENKYKINLLSNFKNTYHTVESFQKLNNSIKLYCLLKKN